MSFDLSRFSALSSTLLLVSLLSACGGGGDDDSSDACDEAAEHSDLAWIQENIFNNSCALSSACHQGSASMAAGLNLQSGNSQANLVNVPAMNASAAGLDLVEPGDPENSYLLVIMGAFGIDDPRIPDDIGTMPYNSGLLCDEKFGAIERWIDSL